MATTQDAYELAQLLAEIEYPDSDGRNRFSTCIFDLFGQRFGALLSESTRCLRVWKYFNLLRRRQSQSLYLSGCVCCAESGQTKTSIVQNLGRRREISEFRFRNHFKINGERRPRFKEGTVCVLGRSRKFSVRPHR